MFVYAESSPCGAVLQTCLGGLHYFCPRAYPASRSSIARSPEAHSGIHRAHTRKCTLRKGVRKRAFPGKPRSFGAPCRSFPGKARPVRPLQKRIVRRKPLNRRFASRKISKASTPTANPFFSGETAHRFAESVQFSRKRTDWGVTRPLGLQDRENTRAETAITRQRIAKHSVPPKEWPIPSNSTRNRPCRSCGQAQGRG